MRTTIFIFMSLLVLQLVGCTRAAKDESAKVSIALPATLSSKASASSTATLLLSHVVINATGAGIPVPIVGTWDSCHDCPNSAPLPSTFQLDVTSGTGRLIQVLAVYKDSVSGQMIFYYGDSTTDLNGSPLPLNVGIFQVGQGNVTGGRVSGRYLSTATNGPTSIIDIKYNPGNGKPALIVDRNAIVNGWFSVFMLSGANLQYVVRDTGEVLWGQEMSFESAAMNPSENSGAYFDQRARAYLPVHVRVRNDGGTTSYYSQDAETFVWGYWGPGAVGKKICTSGVESTPSALNLKKYASTNLASSPNLTVSHYINHSLTVPTKAQLTDTSSPMSSIVVEGGANMSSSCASFADTATNQYENFQKITLDLFDGNGGDSVAGFRGIFRNTGSNNFVTISTGDPRSISGQVLPGVETVFDSLRLFKRLGTEDMHLDTPSCAEIAAGAHGFVAGSSSDAAISSGGTFSLSSTITSADASAGVSAVLCPVKNGGLSPIGVFIGKWMFSSYGSGGSTGGTPAKIGLQNLTAFTVNQCGYINLSLLTSSDSPASSSSAVTANLSATGSGSAFYAESDYNCAGSPVTSIVVPPNSSWVGLNFKTNAATETDITLTPTDPSAALTSVPKTVRARAAGSVTNIMFNASSESANVGTCLSMAVKTVQTDGAVIPYSGPVTLTSSGVTIYTDAGCTTSGSPSFVSGVASFYIKGTVAGWANLQASATIDSINFLTNYGIGIFAAGQPTHLVLGTPAPAYLYINQCMPITVTAQDDTNTAAPVPAAQAIKFSSSGGGAGNNFYTDANCTNSMVNSETNIASGQSSIPIYFKPQNYGAVNVSANIDGNNYHLSGGQGYTIGNLWMHVITGGFNGTWYDNTCGTLIFQLMDNYTAGTGNVIPNHSGSPASITVNTNSSTSNGGLYSVPDCSDAVSASKATAISSGSSSSTVYMRSLLASGPYVSIVPTYSGPYSPIYQNGNTITSLSFAWCPPLDGGGACPSSLALSGTNVGGGVALYSPAVTVSSYMDKTITITNTSGSGVTFGTFTITGVQAAEYTFKGGPYPGTGGTCGSSLAPSSSCTVVVTFTPAAIGGRYANLNILYNSTTLPLALQGNGQ